MFGLGNKRKLYNGAVDTKLNNEYQIDTRGDQNFPRVLGYLELIDKAWHSKFSEDEAALYIATLFYCGLAKAGDHAQASALFPRLQSVAKFGLSKGMISEKLAGAALRDAERAKSAAGIAIDPIKAIKSGNLAELRQFIQASPHSLDTAYDPNQWTLLHCLAGLGSALTPVHSTMALELISAGADVNCRTPLGWTPLIIIAIEGHKEAGPLAKLLVEHGADVGAVDENGADWSIFWQHGEEIRAILNAAMTPAQRETNRLRLERLYSKR